MGKLPPVARTTLSLNLNLLVCQVNPLEEGNWWLEPNDQKPKVLIKLYQTQSPGTKSRVNNEELVC